jgi:hypothetical protein
MSWRGLAVVGVTLPDGTGSAAGSPRPATGESNGPSPSTQDLVYCPSPPPVTGRVPSFLRRVEDVRKSCVGAMHVLDLDGLLGAGGDSAGGVPVRAEGGVRTLLRHVNHVQRRANSSAGTSVPSRLTKAPDGWGVINSVRAASLRALAHLGAVDALGRDVLSSRLTLGATAAGTAEMSAEPRDSSIPVLRSAPRCGTRDRTRGRLGLPTGNHRHPSVQNSA